MSEDKYFSTDELNMLRVIAEDFSLFLLKQEKVDIEIASNPMFIAGMLHGSTSTLLLLNDYIIAKDGTNDRGLINKIHENILVRKGEVVTKSVSKK